MSPPLAKTSDALLLQCTPLATTRQLLCANLPGRPPHPHQPYMQGQSCGMTATAGATRHRPHHPRHEQNLTSITPEASRAGSHNVRRA